MSIVNILKKLNSRDTRIFPTINTLTKIIFIGLIAITATFFVKNILAATKADTISAFQKKQNAMEKGNNQESWMNEAASSNAMVGVNALTGPIPQDVLEGKNTTGWIPSGIIGATNKSIAYLYTPPFSGIEYLASIKDNFLGKPVYAQNTGFKNLSALLPLWKGFRNATYGIFSIIFVIMGIMIMLRVKISPQAVITIQNSIPKLITALILVTFSYAIVGLLIDLSYLIEALGISLILKASGKTTDIAGIIQNPSFTTRLFGLVPFWQITGIAALIGTLISLIAGPIALFGSLVGFLIVFLGMILIILILSFKFFFGLIKCYINILIKTIIAPLEIALGAIPNMKMGFGSWFIDIIANILVFPISLIFIIMLKTIMEAVMAGSYMWSPQGLEFLSGGGLLSAAIGIGGLVLVAKLPTMIPEFIFQIKPSPFGKAIGEGLSSIPIASSAYKSMSKDASETFGENTMSKVTNSAISNTLKNAKDKVKNAIHKEDAT